MKAPASLLAIAFIALVTGLTPAAAAEDDTLDVAPAIRAAESWLSIVDSGRYGTGWDEAATMLKDSVPRLRFETSVQSAREPLGPAMARKLRAATYTRSLPGAPGGEYVVIQFETEFDKRPRSVETVTPMREPDGSWKVSGYYIR